MSSYTQHDVHKGDVHGVCDTNMHEFAQDVHIKDTKVHDVDINQHRFVVVLDFEFVVSCTMTFKKELASSNENATNMFDHLQHLVIHDWRLWVCQVSL